MGRLLTLLRKKNEFSPLDLGALLAGWYDPSDLATITQSSGAVSQLDDKSGLGRHLKQGTGASQPITGTGTLNGLNALSFNGTSHNMLTDAFTAIAQPYEVAVVARSATGVGNRYILDGISSTDRGAFGYSTSNVWRIFAGTILNSAVAPDTNRHVFRGVFNGAASELVLDGASLGIGDIGAHGRTGVRLGAIWDTVTAGGFFWDGLIAEMVVTNGALSPGQRTGLDGYLAGKWGVALG